MKSILYIISFLVFSSGLWSGHTQAQAVFNDTILFQITKIRLAPNGNSSKYLMEFQTAQGSTNNLTGKMVLSMCNCYCDSIWDAWPAPSDSIMTGGTATLTHMSTSSGNASGSFGLPTSNRQRGMLNIWQMPGSFIRTDPFSLPAMFILD